MRGKKFQLNQSFRAKVKTWMHVFKNLKIQRIRREVNICSILESKRV